MTRGDVVDVDLNPVRGSEQAGVRPIIVLSRDALHQSSTRFIGVPCTTYRQQHLYPTNAFIQAGDGGLSVDSVALCDQVRALSQSRIERNRGSLSAQALARVEEALLIALDLT